MIQDLRLYGVIPTQTTLRRMSLDETVALLALAVGVIAVPVSVWAARRWGSRRARTDFTFSVIPLLPIDDSPLEVTYHDLPVDQPHLVSVSLRNTGPRDIPSSAFDGGQPILVRFDTRFYGLTSRATGGARTLAPAVGSPADRAVVQIEPGLLKRGESWSFNAVVSGRATVSLTSPLVDTDVTQNRPESSRWPTIVAGSAGAALGASLAAVTAAILALLPFS